MKTLIAGFGNIFFSDDGLGPAVARMLAQDDPGPGVRVRDFGTGGMYLALEMLNGYDTVVILDAVAREEPPGTLFAIEAESWSESSAPDPHAMDVGSVLALFERLRTQSAEACDPRIVVVGCVPETLAEGMELSEPVRAALPACANLARRIANESMATGVQ